jgi:hypothetical protein
MIHESLRKSCQANSKAGCAQFSEYTRRNEREPRDDQQHDSGYSHDPQRRLTTVLDSPKNAAPLTHRGDQGLGSEITHTDRIVKVIATSIAAPAEII